MSDLPTTTILVGLAVALARAIEWLAKAVMQKSHTQNNNGQSGSKPTSYWILEFGRILDEKLENHEPKIRQIIREELGKQ